MFLILLLVNFVISLVVCLIIAMIFRSPIAKILQRLVAEDIYTAWSKYITFAIYVVGISGGVRVWDLEKYITPKTDTGQVLLLTQDRWILEIYRTIISTLQSDTWMLLLFFIFALLAFVVVKGLELRKNKE
jgi:sensor histidine kinase regulating citrate/malate metabolism